MSHHLEEEEVITNLQGAIALRFNPACQWRNWIWHQKGLRSGSETCQRCRLAQLLAYVLAHRGKENPAKMQSKVHELSHISSCFIYPSALFLPVFFLLHCISVRYSALCRLKASDCLAELWKVASYLLFMLVCVSRVWHIWICCIDSICYILYVSMDTFMHMHLKTVLCWFVFFLLLPFPWNTRQTSCDNLFRADLICIFLLEFMVGNFVTHAWKHLFAYLDDIRFLEAGLSGCVLYQQIRCKVEKFFCPFLQRVKCKDRRFKLCVME